MIEPRPGRLLTEAGLPPGGLMIVCSGAVDPDAPPVGRVAARRGPGTRRRSRSAPTARPAPAARPAPRTRSPSPGSPPLAAQVEVEPVGDLRAQLRAGLAAVVAAGVPDDLDLAARRGDLPRVRVGLVEAEQRVLLALHQHRRLGDVRSATDTGDTERSRSTVFWLARRWSPPRRRRGRTPRGTCRTGCPCRAAAAAARRATAALPAPPVGRRAAAARDVDVVVLVARLDRVGPRVGEARRRRRRRRRRCPPRTA